MKAVSAHRIANDKVNICKCTAAYNKLLNPLTVRHYKRSLILDVDDTGLD